MTIILLTYVNRSGSTYLANMLSASDSVCVCPEGERLVSLFLESPGKDFQLDAGWESKLLQIFNSDSKLRSWGIRDDVITTLDGARRNIDAFVAVLKYYQLKQKPGASSILFKAERLVDLFASIDQYKGSGIGIKYLSLIRDPRAIYASQKRTLIPGTDVKMSKNPVYTSIFWNHFMRMNKVNIRLLDIHPISYQDMIQKTEETISILASYLELDLQGLVPGEGDLKGRLPLDHRTIHQSIDKLPDPLKIDQWKEELGQEEVRLIELKCMKYLMVGGYERTYRGKTGLAMKFKLVYFTLMYYTSQIMDIFSFQLRRILFNSI